MHRVGLEEGGEPGSFWQYNAVTVSPPSRLLSRVFSEMFKHCPRLDFAESNFCCFPLPDSWELWCAPREGGMQRAGCCRAR